MGRIVIVAYRRRPGRQKALEALMRQHHDRLRAEGLVTDRQPVLMRAADGTIVEVFEWTSANAIASAHANAHVQRMWTEYAEVSEYVPLRDLPEAAELFAEFEPLADGALHPELSP
jgi:quinol monooxygenase YgiN